MSNTVPDLKSGNGGQLLIILFALTFYGSASDRIRVVTIISQYFHRHFCVFVLVVRTWLSSCSSGSCSSASSASSFNILLFPFAVPTIVNNGREQTCSFLTFTKEGGGRRRVDRPSMTMERAMSVQLAGTWRCWCLGRYCG